MGLSYFKEHYGDLSSVVGLLITFVGFIVTIRNVRKAKQAAEEARQAAREAVSRIGSQILVNEIGTALELVRQTDAACRGKDWSGAIYRSDEARTRLAQLIENPELKPEEREVLRFALDGFIMILSTAQKILDSSEPKKVPPRIATRLNEMIAGLGRIKSRLQTRTLEI
jgi:hypothetical protein